MAGSRPGRLAQNAPGASIWASAGSPGNLSPTSLVAQSLPTGANPYASLFTAQYTLSGTDGATWQTLDSALNLILTPGANGNALLGGNADLFTDTSGFNQEPRHLRRR